MTNWIAVLVTKGPKALESKVRTGRRPMLDKKQREYLGAKVLAGPQAAGYPTSCWTLSAIQDLILKDFDVEISLSQIHRILVKLGIVSKKGSFRLNPSSPEERTQWLNQRIPKVAQAAKQEGAAILFGDEVGFAPGRSPGYSWGKSGEILLVRYPGKNLHIKAFGAVDIVNGSMCYHVAAAANGKTFKEFLHILLRKYGEQKVYLILDNVNYHHAVAKRWADPARIEFAFLPSYSPDFNPIEQLWKVMKGRYIKNFEAFTKPVLRRQVLRAFRSIQHSFTQYSGTYRKWSEKADDLTSRPGNVFSRIMRPLTDALRGLKIAFTSWARAVP